MPPIQTQPRQMYEILVCNSACSNCLMSNLQLRSRESELGGEHRELQLRESSRVAEAISACLEAAQATLPHAGTAQQRAAFSRLQQCTEMADMEMDGDAGPGPSEPPAASRTLYIHNLYERARKEGACDSCTKVHRSSALGAEPAFGHRRAAEVPPRRVLSVRDGEPDTRVKDLQATRPGLGGLRLCPGRRGGKEAYERLPAVRETLGASSVLFPFTE